MKLDELPVDLLSLLLSFLDIYTVHTTVTKLNRLWRGVVNNPITNNLRRSIIFNTSIHTIQGSKMIELCKKYKNTTTFHSPMDYLGAYGDQQIKTIMIYNFRNLLDVKFSGPHNNNLLILELCSKHTKLKKLSFTTTAILDINQALKDIGQYCSELEHLKIISRQIRKQSIDIDTFNLLSLGCSKLKYLSLISYTFLVDGINNLTYKCPNIETLQLIDCVGFECDNILGLYNLNHMVLKDVNLTFGRCRFVPNYKLDSYQKLETVAFTRCRMTTETFTVALLKQCTVTLKEIKVVHTKITDDTLIQLSENTNLEVIMLDDNNIITDVGIFKLYKCTKLRDLTVTLCSNITVAVMNELQNRLPKCKMIFTTNTNPVEPIELVEEETYPLVSTNRKKVNVIDRRDNCRCM